MVTSDPLHAACERKARLQRQWQKQEEWRAVHSDTVLGSTESSMEGVQDGSAHELTPIPIDCECMDTEGGDLLWYEEHVVVDKAKAMEVFDCTIHQSLSTLWYNEHAKCITASMAKEILCCKPTTDPARFLSHLTSTQVLHTEAIDYGGAHEGDAVGVYSCLMSCVGISQTVSPSGFICAEEPWLGPTLHRIVGSGIIKVKCLFVCCECLFKEAAATKRTFCLQNTQHGLRLCIKHRYYHQVQVQLFVLKQSIVTSLFVHLRNCTLNAFFETVHTCKT